MISISDFVSQNIILRDSSFFGKDIVNNNQELYNKINHKRVLVIGGAGSIGSSFIKAILIYKPSSLVVVDINENGLAELVRDLRSGNYFVPEDFVTYPIDYASDVFKKMYVSRNGFDIVANFSAHKHVRSEKDIFSIEALLTNNLLNAKKLLDILKQYPPESYFCVSTDKAANPVNIMGASKRIMEDLIFSYSDSFPVKTARFANVAFSNGSLPAGFLERIQKRQPIGAPTNTKRFFVSMEESGQICMLACFLGKNREIFYPKLKESQMMTFDKIAELLLKEMGYSLEYFGSDEELKEANIEELILDKKYPVHFSPANTSGEKEFEEFFMSNEKSDESRYDSIGVITEKKVPDKDRIDFLFSELEKEFKKDKAKKENIINIINEYIPEFSHIETGISLDSKI